jgi:hypothetical protein
MARKEPSQKMQAWIEARARQSLTHAEVQMARALGMNPTKLGKIDNHEQEPWKVPLPQFIEGLYLERFGKPRPDAVVSVEERCRLDGERREARRAAGRQAQGEPRSEYRPAGTGQEVASRRR